MSVSRQGGAVCVSKAGREEQCVSVSRQGGAVCVSEQAGRSSVWSPCTNQYTHMFVFYG